MPVTEGLVGERTIDVGATLAWYRRGFGDPTTLLGRTGRGTASVGTFVRGAFTPAGPATISIRWRGLIDDDPELPGLDVEVWGPGGAWLEARVPAMVGLHDPGAPDLLHAPDPAVAAAARARRFQRIGATGDLYHALLPTILEQRITSGEAKQQWKRLCLELGEPAPGPFEGLLLPPAPAVLATQPTWWFHPLGIERKRATPLTLVARHASKLWAWAELPPADAAGRLRLLRGIGEWTIGSVLGPALGDPDAVPVGDYHIKHIVGYALEGTARSTDERMLELLEPYAGQRGRVVRLLKQSGHGAPKFGPRQRILPMHAW